MTITAEVIADSISLEGIRITTMQLRYPRFIHAELMTHRVFSRNASSSRAIPVEKMIADLRRDPAMPIHWGKNQKGMQADQELDYFQIEELQNAWLVARDNAILSAQGMIEFGLHKQIANRILEPWAHINVVVTATDWNNFFVLRRHKDAQPEMKALADAIYDAMQLSAPRVLEPGDWHLPYADDPETSNDAWAHVDPFGDNKDFYAWLETLKQVSTARCARVSYLTFDGVKSLVHQDVALYNKLITADVLHASPAEHQATPDTVDNHGNFTNPKLHGNFSGWCQYRKSLNNEFIIG